VPPPSMASSFITSAYMSSKDWPVGGL
jgi:hypothetical protein